MFSWLLFLGEFILSVFLILLFGGLLFELKKNYSKKSNFFILNLNYYNSYLIVIIFTF